MAALRARLQRLLLWRVWERMLEIEFVDRSVALAGKAFVSFFPLVIVVAAFVPERRPFVDHHCRHGPARASGETRSTLAREAFASSDDVRQATGVLGLVLTIFFASSFTTALQRVYLRAWRRPPHKGVAVYWRGLVCLLAVLAAHGAPRRSGRRARRWRSGSASSPIVALAVTSALWWFSRVVPPAGRGAGAGARADRGDHRHRDGRCSRPRPRSGCPTVVADNEAQFGIFGIALALVTWFSGAAICVLIGACAGVVFAEDTGRVGALIRGGDPRH